MLASSSAAAPARQPIAYTLDGTVFEGVLVYDDAESTPRPGLLMAPNWLGINEDNLQQAEEVAGQGYVVFVADLYGKDVRPKTTEKAAQISGAVKADRRLMRARMAKALEVLRAAPGPIDKARIAAIGFCFGGTAVMELAKDGADVGAVVSFHGGLDAVGRSRAEPIARILALHGADDPAVPPADVQAWKDDLRRVEADWTLVEYGGAVHSFTDRKANVPGRNMYDVDVARRAYRQMRLFLEDSFARPAESDAER